MSEAKAARLAQRAARPGWRGERAGDRLRKAVVAGDLVAARALSDQGDLLDGVWRKVVPDVALQQFYACRYHYRPDGRHPFSLLVWRPEAEVLTGQMRPGVVVAAATEHPVAEIARAKILAHPTDELVAEVCEVAELHPGIAAFADENGLVPADPVRKARYLLMTGRLDAYRAVDPDGELLARAYAAASDKDKARLRERALRLGDVDTIRLLVDRNRAEEIARLRDQDVLSLGRAFADGADWPALWRLATDASVLAAASLVPLFGTDWSPAAEPERRLLDALRSVTAAELTAVRDAPTLVRRIDIGGTVIDMSVAPDAAELAASWTVFSESGSPVRVDAGVFDLGTGDRRDDLASGDVRPVAYVAHCGEAGFVRGSCHGLVRSMGDRTELLCDGPVLGLASAAGNFAAWTPDGVLLGVAGRSHLVPAPAASLDLGGPGAGGTRLSAAASADGSRFAFGGYDRFVVVDATGKVLTRSGRLDRIEDLTFLGPAELVTSESSRTIRRWRVGTPVPVECAAAQPGLADSTVGLPGPRQVITRREGRLDVLDGETLQSPDGWRRPLWWRPAHTIARAGDSAFALATFRTALGGYADAVEVHDLRRQPLYRLLDRPVATMRAADLDVAAALVAAFDDPAVRVVHAALAARFGREVSLGAVRARPDDVAIADDRGGASC